MSIDTARLIASLEFQDKNFMRGLKQVEKGIGRVDKKLGAFSGAVNRNVGRAVDSLITRGIDAGGAVIQAAVDQETAIVGIRKTINVGVDGIVDDLKKLSTETGSTFEELAGIAELGGAMGIASEDITAFTEQVAILGATTDVTTEDAATSLGQLKTVLGFTGDEFDNFAATLVDLGNKGNSTEAAILEITKRTGAAAKTIGLTTDKTLAWASAAANLGLSQEIAGTAISKLFVGTQKIVARQGDDLKEMGKIAGMTGKQFKKAFDKDASGALFSFIEGLKGLSKEQRVLAIESLFGKGDAMTKTLLGLSEALDDPTSGLTASLKNANTAWEEGTAAQEEADKRFGSSEFTFKRLNNAVNLLSAGIGKELLPVLVELAEEGIEFLTKPSTQKGIKNLAVGLGKGIKGLVSALKGFDWGAVAGFLGTAAGFAGELVTWFQKMPGWAQAFLIGGFAATKLPVIGDLFSGLASGLIKGILGINAGVVNLKAGAVTGMGAGAGAAGAAGGGAKGIIGRLGRGIAVFGTVSIAAASIVALAEAWGAFQETVTAAQADLQGKVDATNKQNFNETIANLQATNKNLARMNGFEEIIASGFGGGQITQNFEDAAARIVAEQGLSRRDTIAALDALKASQLQADELMLETPGLDAAVRIFERRLAKMPTDRTGARDRPGAPAPEKPGDNLFKQLIALQKKPQPNRVQDQELRDIKTATKTAAAHNRVQADELRNTKAAVTTMDTNTVTAVNASKTATTTLDSHSAFRSAAQVTAAGNVKTAVNTNVGATRAVSPPITGMLSTVGSNIVAAIWGARPVIQSTNVVNNYTRTQRSGAPSGSRGGQWGSDIG